MTEYVAMGHQGMDRINSAGAISPLAFLFRRCSDQPHIVRNASVTRAIAIRGVSYAALLAASTIPALADGGIGGIGFGWWFTSGGTGFLGAPGNDAMGNAGAGGGGSGGGKGGDGASGALGGSGGTAISPNGQDGVSASSFGAGGGGGGGGYNGNGPGTVSLSNVGLLVGGNGGAGGNGTPVGAGGGGGGGAGGYGAVVLGGGISSNIGTIIGGNGGRGGMSGIYLGPPYPDSGGFGGDGGVGVQLTAPGAVFLNSGTIAGGNGGLGGAAGIAGATPGTSGSGGVGIAGASVTIINSGTISGGFAGGHIGDEAYRANAITLTGGNNRLELHAGSQIVGNVVASGLGTNDVLRLGGSGNWTLDGGIGTTGQYRNFDILEKTDTSTWTLSGSGDFAGSTSVLAGKLVVNGALASSAVTVASGALLAGSGTVGATTIASGGTIAPGNSIGTLTVNGTFVQGAGSIYQVEVDPGTMTSDLIKVNGAATLATGAGLSVVNYTGAAYALGQRYTILTSTAGLVGTYGFDQTLTPFLSLRDSYDANHAYLAVVQTRSIGDIGTTPNEAAVGKSVDNLPAGNSVQSGVLNQPSLDAARRALNDLSGEIHASAKTALIEDSWLLRAAVNDRLRSAFGSVGSVTLNYGYSADLAPSVKGPMPLPQPDRFAVWGQGYGSWGRTDSDGNAARLKRSTGGFLVGADAAVFDNLRFGVVAGYSRSDFDVNSRLS
uniref:autotransporter outer membrane beta-barrel domain-containing protein n=1 Tax=Bosea sp. UNC402CLCol TaxID=1510531 RepID=UPI0012E060F9